jgi:YD repeat-containing protein
MSGSQQPGLSWFFNDGDDPITKFHSATLGRPLKMDDFKEYLIMPLFKYQDYYAGAVIAFAKAGARYIGEHGCGAYVHIGARYLYTGGGNPLDADFGRGFIGTTAALWAESMGFDGKLDSKQGGSIWGPNSENASLAVQPLISGVRMSGTDDLIVTMTFAIYGATQSHQDDVFYFEDVLFRINEVSGVTMRVDLGLSREGYGDGLMLSGLYDEGQAPYGLVASGIMWALGAPKLLAAHPVASSVLWGIGGVKLLAGWIEQGCTEEESGVGPGFDPYIYFRYLPAQKYMVSNGKAYWEFMTLTTVELLIPTSGKNGWLILPLEYKLSALPSWYWGAPGSLVVNDTLEIAIWFDGAGQSDAGSDRDATSSNPVSVTFPGSYHGYLGGGDNDDWYTFTMESGKFISIHMTPPPFVDFDLELYRPDDTLKAESHQSAGTDIIKCMTECGGTWKLRTYKVQGSGVYSLDLNFWVNHQPNTPSQPSGPSSGYTYTSYSYSTSTTDPDGDQVKYQFSWGDNTYSTTGYYNSGVTVYSSHSWSSTGYKSVKVRAYDGYVWSSWSSSRTVHIISGGGGGNWPCPTLFAWNGNDYVDYGVIDIHNPSGEDVIREVSIAKQDLAVEDGKVKLRLQEGWEGLNFSESVIDQVKLYAIDEDGKLKLCPLTSATHSRLGGIRKYLALSDDVKAQIFLLETIALTFKVREDSQGFIFVIEGCNKFKV